MPNQHKHPLIGWHPADGSLKPRLKAHAQRLSTSERVLLDEALAEYLDRLDRNENSEDQQ